MAQKQEDLIKGFNHQAFAQDLANQAGELVPNDISEEDKKFVVSIVHDFSLIAGDAIKKDATVKLDVNDAAMLAQIIGEWSFHKSIDLIRGKIEPNLRKPILEKVAFTIYEIAKHAISKKMPQEKIIELVEFHVKKSFKDAISELVNKKVIKDDVAANALQQSNVDVISEQMQNANAPVSNVDDTKKIKLASLAYLIKGFPEAKIKNIISKFAQEEAEILTQYLKIENIETKFSPVIAANYLKQMKKFLPEPTAISYDRCFVQLCKIVKNSEKNKIECIIKDERPRIKKFVMSAYEDKQIEMPAMVADVVCRYLKEKVS
ncbi:MAG: hypothetical protein E7Z91_02015 [Cyanobacteria bacterium SIG30]|nr:hypothetical protein [Cyanobacteria bacterium SIG30]